MTEIQQYVVESPVPILDIFKQAKEYAETAIACTQNAFWNYWRAGRLLWDADRTYGQHTVAKFAEYSKWSESYVRDWMKLAKLEEWELAKILSKVGSPTWAKILGEASEKRRLQGLPEHTEESAEALIGDLEKALRRIEEQAAQLERFKLNRDWVLPARQKEEIDGVVELARQDVEYVSNVLAYERDEPYRSEKFLAFVREQACWGCGIMEGIQAHHAEHEGMAFKGSDLSCIPLCPECHAEVHRVGERIEGLEEQMVVIGRRVELLRQYIVRIGG